MVDDRRSLNFNKLLPGTLDFRIKVGIMHIFSFFFNLHSKLIVIDNDYIEK